MEIVDEAKNVQGNDQKCVSGGGKSSKHFTSAVHAIFAVTSTMYSFSVASPTPAFYTYCKTVWGLFANMKCSQTIHISNYINTCSIVPNVPITEW